MNWFHCQEDKDRDVAVLDPDTGQEIRVEKVLGIRRQLGEGRYSLAERLDVVVDKLLDELNR